LLAGQPLDAIKNAVNVKTAGLAVEGLVTLRRNRTTDLIISVLKMAFPPNTIDSPSSIMSGMENWHDSFKDIQGYPKISSHFLGEFQASKTKSLISMIIDRRGLALTLCQANWL
jgi:hypothetical protein